MGQQYLVNKAEFEAEVTELCRYGGMTRRECSMNRKVWARSSAEDALQQEGVCKFITEELGESQIGLPDKHGNTVLHYLAGAKYPNLSLIDWLKEQENGASVWREATNFWGYTPEELYADARFARDGPRASRM